MATLAFGLQGEVVDVEGWFVWKFLEQQKFIVFSRFLGLKIYEKFLKEKKSEGILVWIWTWQSGFAMKSTSFARPSYWYPLRKPTWQWNIRHLKIYFLLKIGIFHVMLVFAGVISMKTRQQENRKAIPEPKRPCLQVDYGHEEAWNFDGYHHTMIFSRTTRNP